MVLADNVDRARLRSVLAHILCKAHLCTDLPICRNPRPPAVAVEIDEPAVGRFDPAEVVGAERVP